MGTPRDPSEALRAYARLALEGETTALRCLSVLAMDGRVSDARRPAIKMLQAAASLGDRASQRLCNDLNINSEGTGEQISAEIVDQVVDAARASVGSQWGGGDVCRISDKPDLQLAKSFLSDLESGYLRAVAADNLHSSTIGTTSNRSPHTSNVRESEDVGFRPWNQDLVLQAIVARMAALTGQKFDHAEPLTVVKYGVGGRFAAHFDASKSSYRSDYRSMPGRDRYGPRTTSIVGYLNDRYSGGETAFPEANLKVAGGRGDVLFWTNQLADGRNDPFSLHGGLPVTNGEKWVVVLWFTTDRYWEEYDERHGTD